MTTKPVGGVEHKDDSAKLGKLFEEAHEYGSKEFGVLWLRANESAIEAAGMCNADQTDPRIKALLSIATLKILRRAEKWRAR